MARIREVALQAIEEVVRHHPKGATAREIGFGLPAPVAPRTLQYRLKHLVDSKRLFMEGKRRWARYLLSRIVEATAAGRAEARGVGEAIYLPLSDAAASIQEYVRRPTEARNPVGRDRAFLHQGNFARYQVRPSEFAAWQEVWKR